MAGLVEDIARVATSEFSMNTKTKSISILIVGIAVIVIVSLLLHTSRNNATTTVNDVGSGNTIDGYKCAQVVTEDTKQVESQVFDDLNTAMQWASTNVKVNSLIIGVPCK
jgi:hypothetical protein